MYLKPVVLSVELQGKLDSFDCGVSDLNLWLNNFVLNNQVRGVSLNSEGVIAFFVLAMRSLNMSPYELPNA